MRLRLHLFLLVGVLIAGSVDAYTGGFSVIPAIIGGPDHTTVSNFDLNTETTNPQMITPDMNYIHTLIIETSEPITSPLLIKEEPDGEVPAFSITVPSKVQDVLVQATIFFWGPNVDSLTIIHDHNGAEPYPETATKVQPVETDASGRVLWRMTVSSFSDFYVAREKQQRDFPLFPLLFITLASISCCLLFKE